MKESAAFCLPVAHIISKMFCFILSFIHQYRIPNDLEIFTRMLDVSMPWEVLLSVLKGVPVGGCRWSSSMHEIHMGHPWRAPTYMPPFLAYDAEATTFLMV